MQSEKRGTLDFFFQFSNKKSRTNEQETESNVVFSSALSAPPSQLENQDPSRSSSSPIDQPSSSIGQPSSSVDQPSCSLNEISRAKAAPKDISMSRFDAPVQNKLSKYPVNEQNRSFQASWFNDRIWLEYSAQNNACYCYYCRHFSSNQLSADTSFTITGFNNWKKALTKQSGLIKHASSQSHITAAKNYVSYKQQQETNSNVIKQLDSSRAIQIRRNRDRLIKICSTLRLLARQMISFRGHEENTQYV